MFLIADHKGLFLKNVTGIALFTECLYDAYKFFDREQAEHKLNILKKQGYKVDLYVEI